MKKGKVRIFRRLVPNQSSHIKIFSLFVNYPHREVIFLHFFRKDFYQWNVGFGDYSELPICRVQLKTSTFSFYQRNWKHQQMKNITICMIFEFHESNFWSFTPSFVTKVITKITMKEATKMKWKKRKGRIFRRFVPNQSSHIKIFHCLSIIHIEKWFSHTFFRKIFISEMWDSWDYSELLSCPVKNV